MTSNPTNITFNIEKVILSGITISPAQRPLLQAALEAELTTLLAQGLPQLTPSKATQPPISSFTLSPDLSPAQLGYHIAQAVYQSIAP